MDSIVLQQPKAFDVINNTIIILNLELHINGELLIYTKNGEYYKIKKYTQSKIKYENGYYSKIEIANVYNIELEKIYLIVNKISKKRKITKKMFIPLIYTPNILLDYDNFLLHKVTKGDTLHNLASKYYEEIEKWKLIYRFNLDKIPNSKELHSGQILRIPNVDLS